MRLDMFVHKPLPDSDSEEQYCDIKKVNFFIGIDVNFISFVNDTYAKFNPPDSTDCIRQIKSIRFPEAWLSGAKLCQYIYQFINDCTDCQAAIFTYDTSILDMLLSMTIDCDDFTAYCLDERSYLHDLKNAP